MSIRNKITHGLAVLALIAAAGPGHSAPRFVSINGVPLAPQQILQLERQLGGRVESGHYLVRADGCWLNTTSGVSGCLGGSSHSRYGSGSRSGTGDWNHWSNAAGGAVGGSADGCIYTTFGWSNC
jgi:hypothetical protein